MQLNATLADRERSVIVAVLAVRAVEVPAHQIVAVVAVGHRLVPTAGTMRVVLVVLAAGMLRRARRQVLARCLEGAFVDVPAVAVVQVPIVQVIGVSFVLDGAMAAARPVLMIVLVVCGVIHGAPPSWGHMRVERRQDKPDCGPVVR